MQHGEEGDQTSGLMWGVAWAAALFSECLCQPDALMRSISVVSHRALQMKVNPVLQAGKLRYGFKEGGNGPAAGSILSCNKAAPTGEQEQSPAGSSVLPLHTAAHLAGVSFAPERPSVKNAAPWARLCSRVQGSQLSKAAKMSLSARTNVLFCAIAGTA